PGFGLHLQALRLPERPARPPERVERAGARLPLAADLRRRRAKRDPPAEGGPVDLVAPAQGLLLAHGPEVRDPRLPPARVLLLPRLPDERAGASAGDRRGRAAGDGQPDHGCDGRAGRAAP